MASLWTCSMSLAMSRGLFKTWSRGLFKTWSVAFVAAGARATAHAAAATCSSHQGGSVTFLGQAEAAQLDEELMATPGFSIDQLMELAGLSVAAAVADAYPLPGGQNILIVAGPGNNGGDG